MRGWRADPRRRNASACKCSSRRYRCSFPSSDSSKPSPPTARQHADDDHLAALSIALNAMRKLSGTCSGAPLVLWHGALDAILHLLDEWPQGASARIALDAADLTRLLLLESSRANNTPRLCYADVSIDPGVAVSDARPTHTEGANAAPESGPQLSSISAGPSAAEECRFSRSGVAVHAGERMGAVLRWVAAASERYAPSETHTDEEKLQRALCTLLCAMLTAVPAEATLGHVELEALLPCSH